MSERPDYWDTYSDGGIVGRNFPAMTPETQALNLLAEECRKRNCAFLINRETGELDTLGQAAVAAVLAAGRAEREAVVSYLGARGDRERVIAYGFAADAISRGDHAPPASEAGEG